MSEVVQSNGRIQDLTEKAAEGKRKIASLTCSPKEAGKIIGIGQGRAYQLCKSGALRSIKIGNKILVPYSAIDDFINEYLGQEL